MRKSILACFILFLNFNLSAESFLSYKDISIMQEDQIDFQDKFVEGLTSIRVENVFPGDTNKDLVVNQEDIFMIGIFYGITGPSRNSNNINWTEQTSIPWQEIPESPINLCHVDCNGDGTIDSLDLEVIRINFGKTLLNNAKKEVKKPPTTTKMDLDIENFKFKDSVTYIGIKITADSAVDSFEVYGLTGELKIDGKLNFMVESLVPEYESSLFYKEEMLAVHNYDSLAKKSNFGLTGKSGFNQICRDSAELIYYYIVMEDDVATSSPATSFRAEIDNVTMIKSDGTHVSATGKTIYIKRDKKLLVVLKTSNSDCQNLGTAKVTILERRDSTECEIKWNNGADYPMIEGLLPGNYSVTISDDKGEELTINFEIKGYGPLSLEVLPSKSNPFAAKVIMTEGIPTIDYVWSDGQTGDEASFSEPGNYSITATDNWGCTSIQSFRLPFEIPLNVTELATEDLIQVSPNPSKDFFEINYSSTQSVKTIITIYNLMGQVVYHRENENPFVGIAEVVDATSWRQGVYLLKAKIGEASFTKKIVRF